VVAQHAAWLLPLADAALALLLAPQCAACGGALEHPTQGTVCPACWTSITPVALPACDVCGHPLPAWDRVGLARARCRRCRRRPQVVVRARAIGIYDGALRAILQALKYDGRRSLARPLAALMRERGAAVLDGADFVVPVPLHHARRRQRGFNQAADLAVQIGLPVAPALTRIRATAAQAHVPASRRHANVRGAFAVSRHAKALQGTVVVLIDDVSTTGATLEACARTLLEVGVREVRALTAARAVTSRR
jgi:ComF family protein